MNQCAGKRVVNKQQIVEPIDEYRLAYVDVGVKIVKTKLLVLR